MSSIRVIDALAMLNEQVLVCIEDAERPGASQMLVCDKQGATPRADVSFEVVSLAGFNGTAVVLGREGEVTTVSEAGSKRHNPIAESPLEGPFRRLVVGDGKLYALGSDRSVWYTRNLSSWERLPSAKPRKSVDEIADYESAFFNLVDEMEIWFDLLTISDSNLYAVGTSGEIYRFAADKWHEIDSPTNASLYSVCELRDKNVAVAGNGVVLIGSENRWSYVCEGQIEGEVQNIIELGCRLLFVSTNGVFSIQDGNSVVSVDIPQMHSRPFRFVRCDNGLLLLCDQQILQTTDGRLFATLFSAP